MFRRWLCQFALPHKPQFENEEGSLQLYLRRILTKREPRAHATDRCSCRTTHTGHHSPSSSRDAVTGFQWLHVHSLHEHILNASCMQSTVEIQRCASHSPHPERAYSLGGRKDTTKNGKACWMVRVPLRRHNGP